MKHMETVDFCIQAKSKCEDLDFELLSVQILECLGGIANLYLESLINEGKPELIVTTNDTFASIHVTVENILQEIQNCTGLNNIHSVLIFQKMQDVFKESYKSCVAPNFDKTVYFSPLGEFKEKDIQKASYFFIYRDPFREDYEKILL